MSELRSKHGMQVEVRQLGTCDYILSNRMAMERKVLTGKYDFSWSIFAVWYFIIL